nr:MAG TPA: hypothetical protein [Caudoviricetes sp.]
MCGTVSSTHSTPFNTEYPQSYQRLRVFFYVFIFQANF